MTLTSRQLARSVRSYVNTIFVSLSSVIFDLYRLHGHWVWYFRLGSFHRPLSPLRFIIYSFRAPTFFSERSKILVSLPSTSSLKLYWLGIPVVDHHFNFSRNCLWRPHYGVHDLPPSQEPYAIRKVSLLVSPLQPMLVNSLFIRTNRAINLLITYALNTCERPLHLRDNTGWNPFKLKHC